MNDPMAYAQAIRALYQKEGNPDQARAMQAYLRDQFLFFGIKAPVRRKLDRQFIKTNGLPSYPGLKEVILLLWQFKERECHYFAIELAEKGQKSFIKEDHALFETLITQASWWDTVDFIASHLVAFHFRVFPDLKASRIPVWMASQNSWLIRSCLLFQLLYKENTDEQLLFGLIRDMKEEKDFFIRKAIGWALRNYSKVNPESVRKFVSETPLSPLSQKEALKWLNRAVK